MAVSTHSPSPLRCAFAPGVPDAWSLGAESVEGLLEGALWGRDSQELLEESGHRAAFEAMIETARDPLQPLLLRARCVRHLAGFAKVRTDAGASATARIELGEVAFRRWDVDSGGWVVDEGDDDLVVAASAVDRRSRVRHRI